MTQKVRKKKEIRNRNEAIGERMWAKLAENDIFDQWLTILSGISGTNLF